MILPQVHAEKAAHDHVMVCVVPEVPDGHILEQTIVHPTDVVRPGPHLLATAEHDPCPAIPRPRNLSREEVLPHII